MDESTQQVIQLGVNITVFVTALSLAISLMLGVREAADKALEYDASLPTGSRIVSVEQENKRIISGNEILTYYSNYISEKRITKSGKYLIKIVGKNNDEKLSYEDDSLDGNLRQFLVQKGIDLNSDYEVITEKYDEQEQKLYLIFKEL